MSRRRRNPERWSRPDLYFAPTPWVVRPGNREAVRKAAQQRVNAGIARFLIGITIIFILNWITP